VARFRFRATSFRPRSELLDFFADMTNAQSWDPSISSVARVDSGDVTFDSSFKVTLGFLNRELELTYHVTRLEPGSVVVLRAETGLFISEDTITVASLDGGITALQYEARLVGKGAAALLDPFFKLSIDHFGKQAGAVLRRDYL